MLIKFLILMVLGLSNLLAQGVIQRSLFSDQKAFKPGDVITIIIIEVSSAESKAERDASRSGSVNGQVSGSGALGFIPETGFSIGTGNEFKGQGSTSTRGTVKAKLGARIVGVDSAGNLIIEGQRKVNVNGDEQIIRIKGIVRPTDVNWDNTVYSYNIADAEIEFTGKGMIYRSKSPSWITRLFHWLF
ncbi:flagellar L-ring protein precursor FlgH [Candidatus Kryptobacter tengchongensis]|uniref:Flagellar L-ring protein FlgH n=1 Tax=Kryptobacter tengchongensis TaxID=1643429 RepID=A0A916LIR6_KRYT1|nr:flagellar L-ring protein precursor FlgH [Candidatus Kryptobacter tengchongensis]CUU08399.1 flagellar L-ring protein precursor FlgH [Candidatus Kryptobacter tengchongensis]